MKIKKINILQLLFSLDIGGSETVAVNIARRIDRDKFNVTFCCLRGGGPLQIDLTESGVSYYIMNQQGGLDLKVIAKLTNLIHKREIDVIHSHHLGPLMYAWLSTRFTRTKTIVHTEHSYDYLETNAKLNRYARFFFQKPAKLVGVTEDVTNYIRNHFKMADSKLITIHNGIDLSKFSQGIERDKTRAELNIDKTSFVVGTVGRLEPIKNYETLITAFGMLVKSVPNSILVFVGEGSVRNRLESLVNDLDLTGKVIFFGLRRDIPNILKSMDVFVLPSHSEGLSIALLEAMSAKIPVVASGVGGNVNIITNGTNGILFEPKRPDQLSDALCRLWKDADLRKKYSENAFNVVKERYSLEKMIEAYQNLYCEAIHGTN